MRNVVDTTVTDRVVLDDTHFNNVTFNSAEMVYSGGTPPEFVNCRFTESRFVFEREARNTVALLRSLSPESTNMRGVVLGLLPELNLTPPTA